MLQHLVAAALLLAIIINANTAHAEEIGWLQTDTGLVTLSDEACAAPRPKYHAMWSIDPAGRTTFGCYAFTDNGYVQGSYVNDRTLYSWRLDSFATTRPASTVRQRGPVSLLEALPPRR